MTKKLIGLFLAAVVIIVMITGCAEIEETSTETMATTEETIAKTAAATIEEQIKAGQTYSEVREIIGFDGKDIGYGAILYEWKIEGGDSLLIWFSNPNTDNAVFPDDLIVRNCKIKAQE